MIVTEQEADAEVANPRNTIVAMRPVFAALARPRAAVGERRWFPHNDFAGEPMQEDQFREPYPMAEEREAIARIIDPGAWEGRERFIAAQGRDWQYNADAIVRESLTRADSILALQSPPAKVEP